MPIIKKEVEEEVIEEVEADENNPEEGDTRTLDDGTEEMYFSGEWIPTTIEHKPQESKSKKVGSLQKGKLSFGKIELDVSVQPMEYGSGKKGYNMRVDPNQRVFGAGNYYVRQPKKSKEGN